MVEERLKSRVPIYAIVCLDKVPAARDNGANGGVHHESLCSVGACGALLLLGGVIAASLARNAAAQTSTGSIRAM